MTRCRVLADTAASGRRRPAIRLLVVGRRVHGATLQCMCPAPRCPMLRPFAWHRAAPPRTVGIVLLHTVWLADVLMSPRGPIIRCCPPPRCPDAAPCARHHVARCCAHSPGIVLLRLARSAADVPMRRPVHSTTLPERCPYGWPACRSVLSMPSCTALRHLARSSKHSGDPPFCPYGWPACRSVLSMPSCTALRHLARSSKHSGDPPFSPPSVTTDDL